MLPALVLTAGLGTRLDPLTRIVAKPAVPLAGRTLIERALDWLVRQGVRDAVLNLHHLPETITSVVGDGGHLGLRVRYSWEREILGSAGGPRRALPLIASDEFLVVNGDTLCDLDLATMLAAHHASGADVTMALVRNPAPDHYNGVALDDTQRVTGFVPRGQAHGSWHFVGIQITKASVFAALADGVPAETVAGLYRERIAAGGANIFGFPVDRPFLDVGTPGDYATAAFSLAGGDAVNVIEAGAVVAPDARLTRTVVWPGSVIGAGARLDGCVVAGATVPAGFTAERAVVIPRRFAREHDDATLTETLAIYSVN